MQKLAQNPPKSDKRIKQTCNPPFWGDVGIKKWSRFFCFGIRSAIFWHLKTGIFGESESPVLEQFSQLDGQKTKSAVLQQKMASNQKMQENKLALKFNFT